MDNPNLPWDETDPEVLQRLWKQRAEHLAQAPALQDPGKQIDLVIVRMGSEYFGLEARHVYAIRAVGQVTPVQRVPDWVLGVTNLRGRILSLIDLSRFYNLQDEDKYPALNPQPEMVEPPSMVVVETPGMEVALYVKEVLTVEAFAVSRIHEAGDILPRFPKGAVSGILFSQVKGSTEDRTMIIILNVPALLADKRLIINEEFI